MRQNYSQAESNPLVAVAAVPLFLPGQSSDDDRIEPLDIALRKLDNPIPSSPPLLSRPIPRPPSGTSNGQSRPRKEASKKRKANQVSKKTKKPRKKRSIYVDDEAEEANASEDEVDELADDDFINDDGDSVDEAPQEHHRGRNGEDRLPPCYQESHQSAPDIEQPRFVSTAIPEPVGTTASSSGKQRNSCVSLMLMASSNSKSHQGWISLRSVNRHAPTLSQESSLA